MSGSDLFKFWKRDIIAIITVTNIIVTDGIFTPEVLFDLYFIDLII